MTPTITITVSGPQGCGKTQLVTHLGEMLRERPFVPVGIEAPEIEIADGRFTDHITPAARVPVPLGPNVTRDGREARVICNDREGGCPVIALFKSSSDSEVTSHHFADGTVNLDGTDHPSDLVGHLPPEPREWWVCFGPEGPVGRAYDIKQECLRPGVTQIHVLEVLP